ncbi:hypothetical protein ACHQM5_003440 [Ranunculus cassubicifolius]
MSEGQDTDKNIEIWKIKKLIKALEAARGNGTSMISLIMPPREFGTASNIKSRVNRQSVLGAITSAQERLKLYKQSSCPNGLGKKRMVTMDFEPVKPINASLYLCDNKFHTEALNELLESDDKFGFIVMDGNRTLFGTLSGNTQEDNLLYVSLVSEWKTLATQFYSKPNTSQPNVSGLIVKSVRYNGSNQAIELSSEILSNVKFIREERLIGKYFEEIVKIQQLMRRSLCGKNQNLDINRYVLKHSATSELIIKHFNQEQEMNQSKFQGCRHECLIKFGCTLEFVKKGLSFVEALVVTYDDSD